MNPDVPLFSYGTLQLSEVQLANYGRTLEGEPDALIGYRMIVLPDRDPHAVRISGTKTHFVVRRTGDPEDRGPGIVYWLTAEELAETDRYEGTDYGRIRKTILWVGPRGSDADGGEAFAEQMSGYADVGVDEVHVLPFGDDPGGFIEGLGEHVVPLLTDV